LYSDPALTEERCIYYKETQKIFSLNVIKQCPAVLLPKVGWRYGKGLRTEGKKAKEKWAVSAFSRGKKISI
jgi:hypothetical protein